MTWGLTTFVMDAANAASTVGHKSEFCIAFVSGQPPESSIIECISASERVHFARCGSADIAFGHASFACGIS
jgi:hypothetical protein